MGTNDVTKQEMDENNIFGQITALMERCKQLELVNETQWLLINNMEKNLKDQQDSIKRLVTHKVGSEENFATLAHQTEVMKSMISVLHDRIDEGIT